MKKILIVGTKNTYRSIFISEYLNYRMQENKKDIIVKSAGIIAFPDIPAEEKVKSFLQKLNIKGDFKSSNLNKNDITGADYIITLTEKIKNVIKSKFKEKQNIYTLKEFLGYENINDDIEKIKEIIDTNIEKFLNI